MQFLDYDIAPLGMGCWPIGGPMFSGSQPLGYSNSNDSESIRTIHAALAGGLSLFDTAAAYGAGHAERLLARALKNRPDAVIVTKIGIAIDEKNKQLMGDDADPQNVTPAIERCLSRLGRDRIDLLLLHQNGLSVPQAKALFDEMDHAQKAGKIRAYGWSTDFSQSASAVADRAPFKAVEHAMNVLVDVPRIQTVVRDNGLIALIRLPLEMGLLTGKYGPDARLPADDIRGTSNTRTDFFTHARANPDLLSNLDAIRELLTVGGRSLTQGAIGWLWAKGSMNLPVPGARSVEQMEGLTEALSFGALPADIMTQIEDAIERDPNMLPDRAR